MGVDWLVFLTQSSPGEGHVSQDDVTRGRVLLRSPGGGGGRCCGREATLASPPSHCESKIKVNVVTSPWPSIIAFRSSFSPFFFFFSSFFTEAPAGEGLFSSLPPDLPDPPDLCGGVQERDWSSPQQKQTRHCPSTLLLFLLLLLLLILSFFLLLCGRFTKMSSAGGTQLDQFKEKCSICFDRRCDFFFPSCEDQFCTECVRR